MSDIQMLPTWLNAGAATLAGAVPPAQTIAEALPGLNQAQSLTPLQRLQRVQESGLAECAAAGEPIYIAWRQFLRGHGPGAGDRRDRLRCASPWHICCPIAPPAAGRGVPIAAGLRQPQDRTTLAFRADRHEMAFPEWVDAIRSLARLLSAGR
jgi:hypothetical protein